MKRPRRTHFAAWISILALAAAPLARAASQVHDRTVETASVEHVLQQVRGVVGHADFARGGGDALLVGSSHLLGIDGEFSLFFSSGGQFLRQVKGRLGETVAFDGTTAWAKDGAGMARILELGDRDRERLLHWVLTGYWLHPKSPVEVRLMKETTSEAVLELGLRDTPMRMELRIDRESWLPLELARETHGARRTWTFSDYRAVKGLQVPHRIDIEQAGGERGWLSIEEAKTPPALLRSPYELVVAPVNDVSFDTGIAADLEVERVFSGHLLVHPVVDGKDVGWFILDSGAGGMCLNKETARELGLQSFGEVTAMGAGGRTMASFCQGERFQLGPVTLTDPLYVLLDLSFLAGIFGKEIGGICGYDLFARCVVEIDAKSDEVAIHDPARYEIDGAWRELFLDSRIPLVEASFEGDHSGLFKIDTGSDANVIFHAPAVERLELLKGRAVNASQSGGVGGTVAGKRGKIDWFELAGRRYEKPSVEFSLAEVGALTDEYSLGNLGQGFLDDFRLVFDYANKRLAFLPLDSN